MTYKIKISGPAKGDAKEYAAFIKQRECSSAAANRWLDGLDSAIRSLANDPLVHPTIPEAGKLGIPYRAIHYHSHRIVFAVDSELQTVIIFRIYHGSRRPLRPGDLENPS